MSRCLGICRKLLYALTIFLVLGSHSVSAGLSVGAELSPMLSLGLNAGVEYGPIRTEIGVHYFVLTYLDQMISQGVFPDPGVMTPVYKAVLSAKFTPWKNHALYGGVGALCEIDKEYDHYAATLGPAFQYAWKFPSRKLELNIDLLIPLRMFNDYETDPEDDLPSAAGFTWLMFILMGPTIGLSWTL